MPEAIISVLAQVIHSMMLESLYVNPSALRHTAQSTTRHTSCVGLTYHEGPKEPVSVVMDMHTPIGSKRLRPRCPPTTQCRTTESVSLVRPFLLHLHSSICPALLQVHVSTYFSTKLAECGAVRELQDSYQERGLPAHFCSLLKMKNVPRGEVAADALSLLQQKNFEILEREKQRDIAAKDLEIAAKDLEIAGLSKQHIVASYMHMKDYLHARGIIGRSRYLSSRAVFPEFLLFSLESGL